MNKVETQTIAEVQAGNLGRLHQRRVRPAASGKTFPTFNPGNGEVMRPSRRMRRGRHRRGRARRARRLSRPGARRPAPPAPKLLMKLAQLVEAQRAEAGRT